MNVADHVLKNTQATLGITFTAGDASGNVTYSAVDAAGTVVQSGTATNEATPEGYYTFVLAPQTAVKSLTITWTGTWGGVQQSLITYAEIVGNHLFTIAEARAFDGSVLADTTDYPEATIRAARAGIADFFEEVTRVSFVPRYRLETLDTPSGPDLWLDRDPVNEILSASVGGTALTAGELADLELYADGHVYRETYWFGASRLRHAIVVAYEHGFKAVPFDIHNAALVYLRYLLVSSDVGDRTVSWSNELGTFRQAVPGDKYPTGIPTVDAALRRYMAPMVIA